MTIYYGAFMSVEAMKYRVSRASTIHRLFNFEQFVGVVQVSIGLACPLLVNGEPAQGDLFAVYGSLWEAANDPLDRLRMALDDVYAWYDDVADALTLFIRDVVDLAAVAAALNTRPRKTLGWRTPAEALNEYLTTTN